MGIIESKTALIIYEGGRKSKVFNLIEPKNSYIIAKIFYFVFLIQRYGSQGGKLSTH